MYGVRVHIPHEMYVYTIEKKYVGILNLVGEGTGFAFSSLLRVDDIDLLSRRIDPYKLNNIIPCTDHECIL